MNAAMLDLDEPLTRNFLLREMLMSQTATRKGYVEQFEPDVSVVKNLTALCTKVLQPLRASLRLSISVSSGYRCPRLNKAIGGATKSQHVRGEAADINVPGKSTEWLYQRIKNSGLPFDQVIQEFDSWVHLSYTAGRNRGQCLRATKVNGKTKYTSDN